MFINKTINTYKNEDTLKAKAHNVKHISVTIGEGNPSVSWKEKLTVKSFRVKGLFGLHGLNLKCTAEKSCLDLGMNENCQTGHELFISLSRS